MLLKEKNQRQTICETAKIGKNAQIGYCCTIKEGAIIGDNAIIEDFAVIGRNCVIGDNVTVKEHGRIEDNCTVGNNCVIDGHVYPFVTLSDNVTIADKSFVGSAPEVRYTRHGAQPNKITDTYLTYEVTATSEELNRGLIIPENAVISAHTQKGTKVVVYPPLNEGHGYFTVIGNPQLSDKFVGLKGGVIEYYGSVSEFIHFCLDNFGKKITDYYRGKIDIV